MPVPPPVPIPRGVPRTPQRWQLDFAYEVFCPWETPITLEEVRASPGLAPLAALTPAIDERALPELRSAIEEALHALFVELLHARDDDAFRALLG